MRLLLILILISVTEASQLVECARKLNQLGAVKEPGPMRELIDFLLNTGKLCDKCQRYVDELNSYISDDFGPNRLESLAIRIRELLEQKEPGAWGRVKMSLLVNGITNYLLGHQLFDSDLLCEQVFLTEILHTQIFQLFRKCGRVRLDS
ncbi:unnamed protein product [Calicophoron daubneyi]|uniref:Saposin B-type domain-containing protein n=1 Tax=Calicophoron daubneyi TaxID=300641 RepID=A0AAV2TJ21_CALDB